jgi:hypothetical protein
LRSTANLEDLVSVFKFLSYSLAQLYLQASGSLLSTSTTRRATVEVFDPASTRKYKYYILKFAYDNYRRCNEELVIRLTPFNNGTYDKLRKLQYNIFSLWFHCTVTYAKFKGIQFCMIKNAHFIYILVL